MKLWHKEGTARASVNHFGMAEPLIPWMIISFIHICHGLKYNVYLNAFKVNQVISS